MQISLNIQDDVYQKLVSAGVDMQLKVNDYLVSLANKKDELFTQEQYNKDMEAFEKSLKCEL